GHGSPRVAVEPSDGELLSRVDRRRRSPPERREVPHAPAGDAGSRGEHQASGGRDGTRGGGSISHESQRKVDGDGAGHDQREEEVLEKQDHRYPRARCFIYASVSVGFVQIRVPSCAATVARTKYGRFWVKRDRL